MASLGHQADVNFADMLDVYALDPMTRAILLYVEHLEDAKGFMSAARAAARVKPVIVARSGRHDASPGAAPMLATWRRPTKSMPLPSAALASCA